MIDLRVGKQNLRMTGALLGAVLPGHGEARESAYSDRPSTNTPVVTLRKLLSDFSGTAAAVRPIIECREVGHALHSSSQPMTDAVRS